MGVTGISATPAEGVALMEVCVGVGVALMEVCVGVCVWVWVWVCVCVWVCVWVSKESVSVSRKRARALQFLKYPFLVSKKRAGGRRIPFRCLE